MIIEIGNKPLSELTSKNIMDIVSIIGAAPSSEFWKEPELLDFDNELFNETITVDYVCYRKSDNKRSCEYSFFLNHKKFYWHYTKDYERLQKQHRHHSREFSMEVWKYLIQQGFDVPLYNNA